MLAQGPYRLDIKIGEKALNTWSLAAPKQGQMVRTVREAVDCPAEFHFTIRGETVFRFTSSHASFEYEKR